MLATGRDRNKRGSANASRGGRTGAAARFEVLDRVGEGTLWIVYRVRERQNGQIRVLKALKGAFNRHPQFVEALARHAEAQAQLDAPGLALCLETGTEDGTLYLVGEWLGGPSLESQLGRGPVETASICKVLQPIIEGLGAMHEHGLCHGDVRPCQIVSTDQGEWKLTDAGAAGALAAAGMATADVQPESAYYLAPERTQGASPSAQTDLYSLGVVLYRMLAGRPPFEGSSPLAIALRHRNDSVLSPSRLNPRCDPRLEAIALALLEKNPARRMNSGQVLTGILEVAAEFAPSPARRRSGALPTQDKARSPDPGASTMPIVSAAAPGADPDSPPVPQPANARRRPSSAVVGGPRVLSPQDLQTLRAKHRRREFWGALGALVGLLLAFGALGGVFYGAYYSWVRDTPREVVVPNYVGMLEEDAQRSLEAEGLTLRVVKEVFDPRKPVGTVVTGDPLPGKMVRARREVVVTISQGQKPITMPNFGEMSLDQARKIINLTGMKLGQVTEQFHDKVPQGYICSQNPDPGEQVRRSDPIALVVSRGPQPAQPDPSQSATAAPIPGGKPLPNDSAGATDSQGQPSDTAGNTDAGSKVSRAVRIRVAVPSDGPSQLVQIVVTDANGENTVYSRLRRPGDIVSERVKITRNQGTTASVRVFVGDTLIKEEKL